jgi:hypothetical protein
VISLLEKYTKQKIFVLVDNSHLVEVTLLSQEHSNTFLSLLLVNVFYVYRVLYWWIGCRTCSRCSHCTLWLLLTHVSVRTMSSPHTSNTITTLNTCTHTYTHAHIHSHSLSHMLTWVTTVWNWVRTERDDFRFSTSLETTWSILKIVSLGFITVFSNVSLFTLQWLLIDSFTSLNFNPNKTNSYKICGQRYQLNDKWTIEKIRECDSQ